MKTVFDPAMLFISESDWENSDKRDLFLQHLLNNLDFINTYQITKVYWTDDLEQILWDHPQLPPWRHDRDFQLKLVPIIYKYFHQVKEFLVNYNNLNACQVQPFLDCSKLGELTSLAFLELMHLVIEKNEQVYFCLGYDREKKEYCFSCDCHSFIVNSVIIAKPKEWFNIINLDSYWPKNVSEKEKFDQALKIMFKKLDKNPIYQYEFTSAFYKDMIKTTNHRDRIIEYIAKRLILTPQEAAQDTYLQDEYINKTKEYRFRITQKPSSTRVHYKYINGNKKIRFLRYYGAGEHDTGL